MEKTPSNRLKSADEFLKNLNSIEITDNIESVKSNLEETNVDNEDGTNNELSLSQDISMKSTEKNTNDDTLDIPAFLRRQRE